MNKRILLVFPGLRPHLNEGAKHRLNSYIENYKTQGYIVDVLCFYRDISYIGRLNKYINSNANWHFYPMILPETMHPILTWLLNAYFQIITAFVSKLKQYNIVQCETNGSPLRYVNKKICRITDFHGDGVSELMFSRGLPERNWIIQYFKKIQYQSIMYSDICITVSDNLTSQLERNTGLKIGKNPIISCGVDLNLYKKASLEYDLGVDVKGRIIVGYCGGLQMWQNINAISDVVRRLYQLDRRIFFVIYTAFDIPDDLNIKLQQLGENNYTVKSLKPSEVPSALKRLDAGFLLRDNLPLNIVSSPTKICEYLAAGVPVICTPYSGDYSRSVQTGRTGYVFIDYPEILESDIERLLCYLIKVKSERDYYSKLCIEAASRRTFDKEYENLTNMIT